MKPHLRLFLLRQADFQQKVLSSAYSNFSVLGLASILIVGGLIIILGYTLESIIDFIERRIHVIKYSRLEWSTNDVLQMHRIANEELSIGTWDKCTGVRAVPITACSEKLAVLDIQDPKHPRLKAPENKDNAVGNAHSSSATKVNSQGGDGNGSSTTADGEPHSSLEDVAKIDHAQGHAESNETNLLPTLGNCQLSAPETGNDFVADGGDQAQPPSQDGSDQRQSPLSPTSTDGTAVDNEND